MRSHRRCPNSRCFPHRMTPSRLSQMTRAVDLAAPDSAAVSATSGARHRRVFSADSADLSEFDADAARSVPPPVRTLSR